MASRIWCSFLNIFFICCMKFFIGASPPSPARSKWKHFLQHRISPLPLHCYRHFNLQILNVHCVTQSRNEANNQNIDSNLFECDSTMPLLGYISWFASNRDISLLNFKCLIYNINFIMIPWAWTSIMLLNYKYKRKKWLHIGKPYLLTINLVLFSRHDRETPKLLWHEPLACKKRNACQCLV